MLSKEIRSRISSELEHLRKESQFRTLEIPRGINLCSNDYLALSDDPRLKCAVIEAVSAGESVGSTGPRLLSGHSLEWEKLESDFAAFAGAESALYFNSGYAANVGLLSSVLRPGDVVFSDALNHASLIDGIRLSGARKVIYPHCDLKFLENALRENSASDGVKVIVTESVFSMEGDVAPLAGLLHLAKTYGAELILDEAHATGVCGPQGRGIAVDLHCEHGILAVVHTCGKALASLGAFVCCHLALKDFLINRARTFIFSTAAPPYMARQISAALSLATAEDNRRAHLREVSALLRAGLAAAGFSCGSSSTHIIPVILGSNENALRVATHLQASGFAVKAIRPPTVPPGTARIRFSLTSRVTREDVDRLVRAMHSANQLPQHASSIAANA
ncbi:MAG TPA: 8-amino-7-oxononanoate synthase [Candidatus Acidoferrales bacterium]|nr:8-amino-7-oxononanoate synthase [Candidatus Acidoferrales bacterium]